MTFYFSLRFPHFPIQWIFFSKIFKTFLLFLVFMPIFRLIIIFFLIFRKFSLIFLKTINVCHFFFFRIFWYFLDRLSCNFLIRFSQNNVEFSSQIWSLNFSRKILLNLSCHFFLNYLLFFPSFYELSRRLF